VPVPLTGVRRAAGVVLAAVELSCAARVTSIPSPGPPPQARLDAAAALVRAGCLDCLLDAVRQYDEL